METKFIEFAEGKIAYDELGSGPLVVCVPGMGDLRSEYRYLAPQLAAAGYRVVTMDVRGHGDSGTGWKDYTAGGVCQDILGLIRHLEAGPAVIIGNSFAAGAAVWAAASSPELVLGLVLVGPAVHGTISPAFRLIIGMLFARPWGPAAWQRYYKGLFTTRKPVDLEAHSSAIRKNLAEKGRVEALHKMMISPTPDADTRLDKVGVPTMVMMGSKDPDFKDPAGEAKWIAGQIKGSTCIMIEGAGHYPHTEMPDISGPHIVGFLDKLGKEKGFGTGSRS